MHGCWRAEEAQQEQEASEEAGWVLTDQFYKPFPVMWSGSLLSSSLTSLLVEKLAGIKTQKHCVILLSPLYLINMRPWSSDCWICSCFFSLLYFIHLQPRSMMLSWHQTAWSSRSQGSWDLVWTRLANSLRLWPTMRTWSRRLKTSNPPSSSRWRRCGFTRLRARCSNTLLQNQRTVRPSYFKKQFEMQGFEITELKASDSQTKGILLFFEIAGHPK